MFNYIKAVIGLIGIATGIILIGFTVRVGFVMVLTSPIPFSFLFAVLATIIGLAAGAAIVDASIRYLHKQFTKQKETTDEA